MATGLIVLVAGLLLIFVGTLQIGNVRRALKTGTISVGVRDTGRKRYFNRTDTPLFYHLNFWPSLFAAIALPLLGAGAIAYEVFLLATRQ